MSLDETILELVISKQYFRFEEVTNFELVDVSFRYQVHKYYGTVTELDLAQFAGFRYNRSGTTETQTRSERLLTLLRKLSIYCPRLEKLRGFAAINVRLTDCHVTSLKNLSKLKTLELEKCFMPVQNFTDLLSNFAANLTTLKIGRGILAEARDGHSICKYLKRILRGVTNLSVLHLNRVVCNGDFLRYVPTDRLVELNVKNCIHGKYLIPFLKRCKNLRNLDLTFNAESVFANDSKDDVEADESEETWPIDLCPCLFSPPKPTEQALFHRNPWKFLKKLFADDEENEDGGNPFPWNYFNQHRPLILFQCLPELKNLQELTLTGFLNCLHADQIIPILCKCSSLTHLTCHNSAIFTYKLLVALVDKLPKLQVLDVGMIFGMADDAGITNIADFWTTFLNSKPNLHTLKFNFSDISLDVANVLGRSRAVKTLRVKNVRSDYDLERAVSYCRSFVNVERFIMNQYNFSPEFLAEIMTVTGDRLDVIVLEVFDEIDMSLVADSIIKHCRNLKVLHIKKMPALSGDQFLNAILDKSPCLADISLKLMISDNEAVSYECLLKFLRAVPGVDLHWVAGSIPDALWTMPEFQRLKHKIFNFPVLFE